MARLLEKLQNPFALVGQGFVLGGVLFFAVYADTGEATPAPAPISAEAAR